MEGEGSGFPGSGIPGAPGEQGAGGLAGNRAPYLTALEDDGLGYVLIVGLMTIYQPPKKTETDANSGQNGPQEPPKAADATDPTKTAQPKNTTQPKTTANGNNPMKPAVNPNKGKTQPMPKPKAAKTEKPPGTGQPPTTKTKSKTG